MISGFIVYGLNGGSAAFEAESAVIPEIRPIGLNTQYIKTCDFLGKLKTFNSGDSSTC